LIKLLTENGENAKDLQSILDAVYISCGKGNGFETVSTFNCEASTLSDLKGNVDVHSLPRYIPATPNEMLTLQKIFDTAEKKRRVEFIQSLDPTNYKLVLDEFEKFKSKPLDDKIKYLEYISVSKEKIDELIKAKSIPAYYIFLLCELVNKSTPPNWQSEKIPPLPLAPTSPIATLTNDRITRLNTELVRLYNEFDAKVRTKSKYNKLLPELLQSAYTYVHSLWNEAPTDKWPNAMGDEFEGVKRAFLRALTDKYDRLPIFGGTHKQKCKTQKKRKQQNKLTRIYRNKSKKNKYINNGRS
jgi:hypothetical protein